MVSHTVRDPKELIALVQATGFLPFFAGAIKGFSLEECTPPDLWFVDGVDGPWEWKGPVITMGRIAYGKFFHNKAGFISEDQYADFANVRRGGMSFDEAYDSGRIPHDEKQVYDMLRQKRSMLSKQLKSDCGYGKHGRKGFDAVIARLQMQGYVITEDFEYARDRYGKPYGWGVARYTTPEALYEDDFMDMADGRTPGESFERIVARLTALMPEASRRAIEKLIRR